MATQKKYICAFCARAFTRSEHKQRHERSHTNEKPFHCQHCTSAFVRRDLLQRHCRTVHNVQLLNVPPREYVNYTAPELAAEAPEPDSAPAGSPTLRLAPSRRSLCTQEADFVHLLLISQKLEQFLASYDAGYPKPAAASDAFLTGYASAAHLPYLALENIARDTGSYLGTINNKPNSSGPLNKYAFFKLGAVYGVMAIGAANACDLPAAASYAARSWDLLVCRLVPHYNSAGHSHSTHDKTEILLVLFLLAYVYVTFDLDSVPQPQVSCQAVFGYLNDLSYIIMSTLDDTSDATRHLEWSIYVLLSRYYVNAGSPPKVYELFKNRIVTGDTSLVALMNNLSRTIIPLALPFVQEVSILTLVNEYNSSVASNFLLLFDLRNSLHNCIILLNKSLALHSPELGPTTSVFELFKKRAIINALPKFHDLLSSYIFCPTMPHHWTLLNVSLKEYNAPFNFGVFFDTHLDGSTPEFSSTLKAFFAVTNDSNNNLGIVSFPFLFNANFIKFNPLKIIDVGNLNSHELTQLIFLAIEWYITMVKILISLWTNPKLLDDFIIQCTFYLVNEQPDPKDDRTFWAVFRKLTACYEKWLAYFDPSNQMASLRYRLRKFLADYIYLRLSLVESSGYETNYVLDASPKDSGSISSRSSGVSGKSESTSSVTTPYSQAVPGKTPLQGTSGTGLHLPPILKMPSNSNALLSQEATSK